MPNALLTGGSPAAAAETTPGTDCMRSNTRWKVSVVFGFTSHKPALR